jgi:phosphonate transport system substrate-binding protein
LAVDHAETSERGAVLNVAIASMISPGETFVHYRALLEYIASATGRKTNLVQRKTYAEVNGLLKKGAIDLAFICSGPYVSGKQSCRFEALAIPLVKQKPVYRAHLLTSRAASVSRFDDLRGKAFAFSDPDSTTGCIVPRFLLAQRGEQPQSFFSRTLFTYSHDNSMLAVSRSLVDAAFVHEHIWDFYLSKNPEAASRLRIVSSSEPYGNPPLVASAFVPEPLRQQVREALFAMHEDPKGAAILRALRIDRFIPPEERLYDPVQRMIARLRLSEDGHAAAP